MIIYIIFYRKCVFMWNKVLYLCQWLFVRNFTLCCRHLCVCRKNIYLPKNPLPNDHTVNRTIIIIIIILYLSWQKLRPWGLLYNLTRRRRYKYKRNHKTEYYINSINKISKEKIQNTKIRVNLNLRTAII